MSIIFPPQFAIIMTKEHLPHGKDVHVLTHNSPSDILKKSVTFILMDGILTHFFTSF